MNDLDRITVLWIEGIGRSTVGLSLAALLVYVLFRTCRIQSPWVHRVAWALVLIQGVTLARFQWDLAWLPHDSNSRSVARVERSNPPIRGEGHSPSPISLQASPQSMGSTTNDAMAPPGSGALSGNAVAPLPDVSISAAPVETPGLAPERNRNVANRGRSARLVGSQSPGNAPTVGRWFLMKGATWLLLSWGLGWVVWNAVSGIGFVIFIRSVARATVAPLSWSREWHRLLRRAKVSTRIPMLVHSHLGPLVCRTPLGYRLVVPADLWEELDEIQRLAVMRHELAHYLRGDIWWSFAMRFLAAIHWFNPFAWYAVHRFEECGEWACDRHPVDGRPARGPEFARALLQIVQMPQPGLLSVSPLASRAADGSLLSERIRRLLFVEQTKDSKMKYSFACLVLFVVLASSLVQVHLVAHDSAPADQETMTSDRRSTDPDATDPRQAIRDFAAQVQSEEEGDELIAQFKQALATEPGQIALQERAEWHANQMRREAEENALPNYLATRFERDENGDLRLSPDQSEYRAKFLERHAQLEADVQELADTMRRFSKNVQGDSEAAKMFRQFLGNDDAPWLVYINGLNQMIRPDVAEIQEKLSDVLVANPEGKLVVRPGSEDQVDEMLKTLKSARAITDALHEELIEWSREVAEKDELHGRLKALMADPLFAAMMAVEEILKADDSPQRRMEQFFEDLEWVFDDTSEGLIIANEREWMEEMVTDFERRMEIAPLLKAPLQTLANRIDSEAPRGAALRDALQSPFALVRLTAEMEDVAPSASEAVRRELTWLVESDPDEPFTIPEEKQPEVIEFVREQRQVFRHLRRKFRSIHRQAKSIHDEPLKNALLSQTGKCLLMQEIRDSIAFRQFDGLQQWIDAHFEKTDVGYVLRDDAETEIREFLQQVQDIQAELQNDDF